MDSMSSIRTIKAKSEAKYLKRKGVTGMDIGPKIVDGKKTDKTSIRVYVAKKRDNVAAKDRIPKTIDGVPTDVIERTFVLHQRKVPVADVVPQADTGRYDPLHGGISIGPCRAIGGFIFTGTLGAIVTHNQTGENMLLSNWHVLAVDESFSVGDTMAQPSRVDTGRCPGDVVGTLRQAVLEGGSAGDAGVDCAVASHDARDIECTIEEIGAVAGIATAEEDMPVRKRGRTTGLTHGTVDSVDLTVIVPYDGVGDVTLHDQIGIEVDAAQSAQFGISGDSGSVVVNDDNEIVGLYFAGTEDGSFGVANPIQAVLDALDVSICVPKDIEKPIKEIEKPVKEFLPEKHWLKDFKEREFKHEKEFKEKDLKEKEFKEKEFTDKDLKEKEFKELKEEKEFKEKELKEKEFTEKDKDFIEKGIEFPFGQAQAPTGAPAVAPRARRCIDFSGFPVGPVPNPLALGGNSFDARDHLGGPWPNPGIKNFGAHTGLDCGFALRISLAQPCRAVQLTLAHYSQPAKAEAFNTDGSSAGTAAMSGPQDVAETLTINGSAISHVVVTAPQNETLLLEFCCSDEPICDKPDKIDKKPEKFEKPEKEKELKEHLPKELKEKELKEGKEIGPKELKDGKEAGPKELKDGKEIGPKELKDGKEAGPKEFKEGKEAGPKELKEKDGKEIFEKDFPENPKGLVEVPDFPGGFNPGPFDRLGRLEARVEQLTHFIGGRLRPDLSAGALNREPDFNAQSADLQKQASDAKQAKDNKDTEKPREG